MAKKVLAHIGQHRAIEQIAAESNHVGLLAVPPPNKLPVSAPSAVANGLRAPASR